MTTSSTYERFRFARPHRRTNGSARVASGWKAACALVLLCAATAIAAPAQVFRTVINFDNSNGSNLWAPLVQGLDGSFYGTSIWGGTYGDGAVFKVTPSGHMTTLYSFCPLSTGYGCSGPESSITQLVQSTDGNLYGTSHNGGGAPCNCGTVFKITPDGSLTVLHSFDGKVGAYPHGLFQATDGNLYGTTDAAGGSAYLDGIIFKMTRDGTMTVLHRFYEFTDGFPKTLMQARDGNFYGTTEGEADNGGTIFRMTPDGSVTTTLYSFDSSVGNGRPWANQLLQATDGNFYGTTVWGSLGEQDSAHTIFKMTPDGSLTTLHTFDSYDYGPNPTIVEATDGNFYGTTGWAYNCYSQGCGTVFKMTPGGEWTILHTFRGSDGAYPWGGLVQATNGTFYGNTRAGGPYNAGTIFSLCMDLGWFNEELPNYGKVGDTINILGTNMTGASRVTFGGFYEIEAPFTIVSPTLIQATVPPGAKTGRVSVVLPSGKIPSNVKFRVTPQITSFTPTDGAPGTLVTIAGVSLSQIWEVTFRRPAAGGVRANFTVLDDDTVTVTVPTGAKTGPIWIGGPGGNTTTTANFTVE